jgi:hypothetical protein
MAKDVIHVDGEDVTVREDTAKAYRGVNWAWLSIGIFVVIMAILAGAFFLKGGTAAPVDPPTRNVAP